MNFGRVYFRIIGSYLLLSILFYQNAFWAWVLNSTRYGTSSSRLSSHGNSMTTYMVSLFISITVSTAFPLSVPVPWRSNANNMDIMLYTFTWMDEGSFSLNPGRLLRCRVPRQVHNGKEVCSGASLPDNIWSLCPRMWNTVHFLLISRH